MHQPPGSTRAPGAGRWAFPLILALLASTIGLALGPAATSAGAASATYTWPEFHNSPSLNGVSSDPAISAKNAATLGVKWMSPLGPSLDSAMVAYDQSLGLTVAYEGGKAGYFDAVNVANGQILWSDYLGAAITSSPLVENGNVWIAPVSTGRVYKLDAATGATECSGTIKNSILSTPVVATPPGGVETVYFGSLGAGGSNGPVTAYAESDCAQLWQWSSYVISGQDSGTWAPLSYGVDASGTGLVVVGSANPDSQVYALDAVTGSLVWHFATYSPPAQDWDVGAGTDISAPGTNGFADGMAYVEGKDGILYALDFTTGKQVWQYNFGGNTPANGKTKGTDALSTPALSGKILVFGDNAGLYAVNAVTGTKIWFDAGTGDINSSPAIVGPAGSRVAAYGDLNGYFHVVNLSTGAMLYTYKTGSLITASPADVNGTLLVDSNDAFLYDFDPGGGNGSLPTTTVTSPSAGATLPNPDGSLTVTGTAAAADGVRAVTVQVQANGSSGPWFQQAAGTFATGLSTAKATLASPGATSTTWSLVLPVPLQAASYQVEASAVGTNGLADGTAYATTANAASVQFSVDASSAAPTVTVSPARVTPVGTITVSAQGFSAGEQVAFTAPTSTGQTVTLATVTAKPSGATAPKTVALPQPSAFGPDTITATGATSGRVGAGSVYVSNDDPQLGYGSLHQGDEPNDSVIGTYQGVSNAPKLEEAWTVAGGGAFDTTPAIDQGVMYYGDQAGDLYAVTQTGGQPVFTLAVGSPIESSPAVDGGVVFFGDDGGALTAVNSQTGATLWTTAIGGQVSSPAVAGGVVYVGSSNGDLVAVDESTGAVDWTVATGGAVRSAPAVDPSAGVALATTQNGHVDAVSATDGTSVWTATVGGQVTGAMIADSAVYVGSSNGTLFALNEATGASEWSAATGSAISAAPILAFGSVTVGTAAGDLSYYRATTGVLVNTQTQFHYPITGLTFSGSLVVLTSSAGALGLIQGAHYLLLNWKFTAPTAFASPTVILNGDVFALGEDGLLRAFTIPNRPVT